MTPPKPYGSKAVSIAASCGISQATKQRKDRHLVGGVMTPPYENNDRTFSYIVTKNAPRFATRGVGM